MKHTRLFFYITLFFSSPVVLASIDPDLDALMSMSLEDLSMLEVNVTSASKREQHISDIPAAIYVISNERIIRSGMKTIADILSLAPGMDVSQFNESNDIISARGFHDGLFNKMLVMIDGRSVFNPIYGGAYWEDIDYVLADIERVEIIRGPSGTIWGGNAVNGVINIITKSTSDTLGSYGQIAYGQHGYKEVSVRHGLQFNDSVTARAFYKSKEAFSVIDEYQKNYDTDEYNTISNQTAGVKFQLEEGNQSWTFSFGGEKSEQYYDWLTIDLSDPVRTRTDSFKNVKSSSFYSQMTHHADYEESQWQTNLWYWHDYDNSSDANGEFNAIDLDTVLTVDVTPSITALFGGGVRYVDIQLQDGNEYDHSNIDYYNRFSEDSSLYDTVSNLYTQFDIEITENLSAQIGIKAEYFTLNDSFEVSPQFRSLYRINQKQKLWLGIGRAVVSPSYFEQKSTYFSVYLTEYDDYQYNDGLNIYLPNENLKNENVVTFDIGYRYEHSKVNFDVTGYISKYEHVRGTDYTGYVVDNNGYEYLFYETNDDYDATIYGGEVAIEWHINSVLKNYTSYSYFSFSQKRVEGDLAVPDSDDYWEIDHQNMLSSQLLWQLNEHIQWDFILKYKDIDYKDKGVDIDNLVSLDTRIGWKKHKSAPLVEIIVTNIGMSNKCELTTYTFDGSCHGYQTEQSIYGKVSYEF